MNIFFNSLDSQPNGNTRENCLTTFNKKSNPKPMWYDRSCTRNEKHKFMCECNAPGKQIMCLFH